MSILTLVRHGQASYMSEDYDNLSPLGELQSRKLGEFWVRHNIAFDRVFRGPAKRHAHTAEIVGELVTAAGLPWPEPQVLPELDEFDAFQMMKKMVPVLSALHPHVAQLYRNFQDNQHTPEAGRLLEKLFEEVARLWCNGEFETPDLETFPQFRRRIGQAIAHMRGTAGRSTSTVAFTSGGPIAATVGLSLDLNHVRAVEFVWLSRNSSFSEFLFSGDRFSLSSFNSAPHLDSRDLVTYR